MQKTTRGGLDPGPPLAGLNMADRRLAAASAGGDPEAARPPRQAAFSAAESAPGEAISSRTRGMTSLP